MRPRGGHGVYAGAQRGERRLDAFGIYAAAVPARRSLR
jgi:hypothetical protein